MQHDHEGENTVLSLKPQPSIYKMLVAPTGDGMMFKARGLPCVCLAAKLFSSTFRKTSHLCSHIDVWSNTSWPNLPTFIEPSLGYRARQCLNHFSLSFVRAGIDPEACPSVFLYLSFKRHQVPYGCLLSIHCLDVSHQLAGYGLGVLCEWAYLSLSYKCQILHWRLYGPFITGITSEYAYGALNFQRSFTCL